MPRTTDGDLADHELPFPSVPPTQGVGMHCPRHPAGRRTPDCAFLLPRVSSPSPWRSWCRWPVGPVCWWQILEGLAHRSMDRKQAGAARLRQEFTQPSTRAGQQELAASTFKEPPDGEQTVQPLRVAEGQSRDIKDQVTMAGVDTCADGAHEQLLAALVEFAADAKDRARLATRDVGDGQAVGLRGHHTSILPSPATSTRQVPARRHLLRTGRDRPRPLSQRCRVLTVPDCTALIWRSLPRISVGSGTK